MLGASVCHCPPIAPNSHFSFVLSHSSDVFEDMLHLQNHTKHRQYTYVYMYYLTALAVKTEILIFYRLEQ